MEITKLSTKGQVVIPEGMRRGLDVGTAFAVVRKNNMIILKRVEGITEEEQKEMKELEKIWK
jgi:bifunctional DNA-binding transcriptional regulator/antitoxin component of YhaV-PrlF toxin-antitoxin module